MIAVTAFGMSSLRPQEATGRAIGGAFLDGAANNYKASFSANPIFFLDVKNLVVSVSRKAGNDKIGRLTIHDHGNSDGCFLGADWVTVKDFEKTVVDLVLLSRNMHPSGWVHLTHCLVGQNENLLQMFAATFGVSVYAATGKVNGFDQVIDGTWTRCSPSGTIYHNAFLPGESSYQFTK